MGKKNSAAVTIIRLAHVVILLFIVMVPFTNNDILISYNFIFIMPCMVLLVIVSAYTIWHHYKSADDQPPPPVG